jgi:hypothetical protein
MELQARGSLDIGDHAVDTQNKEEENRPLQIKTFSNRMHHRTTERGPMSSSPGVHECESCTSSSPVSKLSGSHSHDKLARLNSLSVCQ